MNFEAVRHQLEVLTREVDQACKANLTYDAMRPKLLNWSERAGNLSKVAQTRIQPFPKTNLHRHGSAAFKARQSLATRQQTWGALDAQIMALVDSLALLIMMMEIEESLPARVLEALKEALAPQVAQNEQMIVMMGQKGVKTMTELREVSSQVPGAPALPPPGQAISVLLILSAFFTLVGHRILGGKN